MIAREHTPVLAREVVRALAPKDGGLYVDGTFGAGGYSEALLLAADCKVCGIDRDPDALAMGQALSDRYPGRLTLLAGTFGHMDQILGAIGIAMVDGVALDIGVSSMQLDRPERGFSFRADGPLDMRMGRDGETAADIVNTASEDALIAIIRDYGEERFARRVARAIIGARPFERTAELARVVRGAVPKSAADTIDAATRTFQALRIAVNDELGELSRGMAAAERLLAPGGRLAIVSFHSLEDRRVKAFFQSRGGKTPAMSRHMPDPGRARPPSFRVLTNKPVIPDDAETRINPRARSAKLRAAERTVAPFWPENSELGEAA